jgi:hypothetical protein
MCVVSFLHHINRQLTIGRFSIIKCGSPLIPFEVSIGDNKFVAALRADTRILVNLSVQLTTTRQHDDDDFPLVLHR